ncbi:YdcF family protein [Limosilactobacillus antri]|nr:YdcF family protein [Limosilactobacillus antri]
MKLIMFLLMTVLTAACWGTTIYLVLIRRFKNKAASLAANRWTLILQGLNLLICLPGLLGSQPENRAGMIWQLWLLTTVTAGLATVGLLIFSLAVGLLSWRLHPHHADYLIVLGAGLAQGKVPPVLAARLTRAAQFWQRQPTVTIVVSGGRVHGDQVTEAAAMAAFLLECGLPPEKLLQESQARNTWQNLAYSQRLITQHWSGTGQPRVVVVTSSFHVPRAWIYSRQLGQRYQFLPAPTPWHYLPLALVRDYLGILRDHRWVAGLLLLLALLLGELI